MQQCGVPLAPQAPAAALRRALPAPRAALTQHFGNASDISINNLSTVPADFSASTGSCCGSEAPSVSSARSAASTARHLGTLQLAPKEKLQLAIGGEGDVDPVVALLASSDARTQVRC